MESRWSRRDDKIATRFALQSQPDSGHGEERDEESKTEINVVHGGFTRRLREVDAVAAEEGVENLLARHDEMRNRTMEQRHYESKNQSRKIRNHALSLVIASIASIRRKT